MRRERKMVRHSGKSWRRFVGGWLICLYVFSATPAAPAFVALLGSADRNHRVALQQTADGIQLVLRHECANSPTHRHGLVARALTLLAQRPVAGKPDHVIQFATSTTALQAATVATISPTSDATSVLVLSRDLVRDCGWLRGALLTAPRPPPEKNSLLLILDSTLLLI